MSEWRKGEIRNQKPALRVKRDLRMRYEPAQREIDRRVPSGVERKRPATDTLCRDRDAIVSGSAKLSCDSTLHHGDYMMDKIEGRYRGEDNLNASVGILVRAESA